MKTSMKIAKLMVVGSAFVFATGFSLLPFESEIKEGHFRFENFKQTKGPQQEYVHLMCYAKKPTSWAQPKQYLAGEHQLWVKADISRRGVPASNKHAFAQFNVELQEGKSYMLNRKIDGEKIAMWIQEVETGIGVSDIVVADLNQPLLEEWQLRRDQCREGTI